MHRKSKPANPRREPVGLNYAILSDPRLGGVEYRAIERGRQVIITTHSPLLCDAVVRQGKLYPEDIALLKVRRGVDSTEVSPLHMTDPLFQDTEIAQALASGTEDGIFESLMLRGMLDK